MKVLAIIDMQKDFIDGALGTKEAVSIVPKVAARLKKAREDGETVVFTRDTHHADYLSTQEGRKLPVPHCMGRSTRRRRFWTRRSLTSPASAPRP